MVATVKWSNPGGGVEGSNIAGTTLNSISAGSRTAGVTYDNSTARDQRCFVRCVLGSITPGSGSYVIVEQYISFGGVVEDFAGSPYYAVKKFVTTTTSAKNLVCEMPLAPASVRFVVYNGMTVSTAASGNELRVTPFDDEG